MQKFKVGELSVDKGTPILMEGSKSPQLYSVLSGMGLRYKTLPNGRRQVVNFVLPGDFLGLQSGVMGEMKHSVEASTHMVMCVFDRSDLWNLYSNQPSRAFDLTWLASIQEHFLGEALSAVGQMDAIERLCFGLARFYQRCEALGMLRGEACPFPYTQQDLADALGLSLVHTNKTLMKLRNQQLVAWSESELRILNRSRVFEIAMIDEDSLTRRPLI